MFTSLKPEKLVKIAALARSCNFMKQQIVFSEGDSSEGFHLIIEGKIKVYKLSGDGKEQILHFFGPGEPVGEVPVFEGSDYPAFAEAVMPTNTVFIPKKEFIELIRTDSQIALELLAILSRRLHYFTVLIDDLSLKEVPARLARYLLTMISTSDDNKRVDLEISKTQLAALLGTVPETLSRAMAKMAAMDLIEITGSQIRLLDPVRLEALAWSGRLT